MEKLKSFEELSSDESLCDYCCVDETSRHISAHSSGCEGSWCEEAYETYLDSYMYTIQTELEDLMKHKKVIFSGKSTVVIWEDGTKTIVRCNENDTFDKSKGFLMAMFQKISGFSKKQTSVFFEELGNIEDKKKVALTGKKQIQGNN